MVTPILLAADPACTGLVCIAGRLWPGQCPSGESPRARAVMPPPAEVGAVSVKLGDVGLITELPGRLEASRMAQVRARAAGIVQKRLFVEGSSVQAGQALFQIDASPYEATLASTQASVARAEANLMQASVHPDSVNTCSVSGNTRRIWSRLASSCTTPHTPDASRSGCTRRARATLAKRCRTPRPAPHRFRRTKTQSPTPASFSP